MGGRAGTTVVKFARLFSFDCELRRLFLVTEGDSPSEERSTDSRRFEGLDEVCSTAFSAADVSLELFLDLEDLVTSPLISLSRRLVFFLMAACVASSRGWMTKRVEELLWEEELASPVSAWGSFDLDLRFSVPSKSERFIFSLSSAVVGVVAVEIRFAPKALELNALPLPNAPLFDSVDIPDPTTASSSVLCTFFVTFESSLIFYNGEIQYCLPRPGPHTPTHGFSTFNALRSSPAKRRFVLVRNMDSIGV